MAEIRNSGYIQKMRRLFIGGVKKNGTGHFSAATTLFQLALVVAAAVIVIAGWFFIDRREGFRVGYPSGRTYLAQSPERYVDESATAALRKKLGDQYVAVRVRNDGNTQTVLHRIEQLRRTGNMEFASTQLIDLVNGLAHADKKAVIDAVVDIAEHNYDKAINSSEQEALIWELLGDKQMEQSLKNIVYQLLSTLLIPTVIEAPDVIDGLRRDIAHNVPPVVREIRLGGVIVQRGEIITPGIAEILENQGYPDSDIPLKNLFFILIVTFVWSFWLTWVAVKHEAKITNKEWCYIAILLIIDWASQRFFSGWNLDGLSMLAMTGWLFLTFPPMFAFHAALGGGLIGYLLSFPEMTALVALGCILCGVASGAAFLYIKEASSRIMIWKNIFNLGICLTVASLFIRWGFGLALSWEILGTYLVLCAFWSSLVVAVLPLWEWVFDLLSPLRLLEMSHPSQPLLKRLQLEAPGTYHHTVTVGTLAEAVADKLGMNGLLVKTGAFYHDIGKLKRPHYFVENQSFGDNIHDRLPPKESARLILQHIKDGQALADEYKLPDGIKRFIAEHHGKTFLSYFYNKAVAADKEAGGDGSGIDKADFTYPGPTPKSQETALLMLADSVEAALKGLNKPIESKPDLEKLVGDVIDSKILNKQFVDVDFTLKDLTAIKNAFVEVLMSMYHTREIKPLAQEERAAQEEKTPQENVAVPTAAEPQAETEAPKPEGEAPKTGGREDGDFPMPPRQPVERPISRAKP